MPVAQYKALDHAVYTPELRAKIRAKINWFAWQDEFYGKPIEIATWQLCPACSLPLYHIGFVAYGMGAGMVHKVEVYHCPDCDVITHGEHSH